MKNTPLPLSVAFIDERGKILNIEDMQPRLESFDAALRRGHIVPIHVAPDELSAGEHIKMVARCVLQGKVHRARGMDAGEK